MSVKISVIVPVYNVRPWLDRCVESLLGQTFRDFELILVDDGSTDGSGERCDEWAKRDVRVRVIHRENGGLAAARNTGLRDSRGEWVSFVDSDDYVVPDFLAYLLGLAEKHDADIATCRSVETREDVLPASLDSTEQVFGPSEACVKLGEGILRDGPCSKLYRRKILETCPFPEGRVHEDTATTGKYLFMANKVVRGGRGAYAYFQRGGSITHAENPKARRDQLWAFREAASFFDGVGEREAARLAWDKLRKLLLADIKHRVLPMGELRAFWRKNRGRLGLWDALGIKCRIALVLPGLYRLWGWVAGK